MKEEAQMDITRFINSKDIRKHLKDIGYKFNSLEAAWLIYQCRDATLKEKHTAWRELIETMPDCRIEQRHNTAPQESLHVFLREYMALEDRLASAFYEDADRTDTPLSRQISHPNQQGKELLFLCDFKKGTGRASLCC